MNTCDTQNQKPCCLSLAWQIDFEEAPRHVVLFDNRLLVSSREKMRSYHVGKKTRLVWSKSFRRSNDFQARLGNRLYSFDRTGFFTVHDFWTGTVLMDSATPKDILGAHGFDGGLAIVSKDLVSIFDNRLCQWKDSKKFNVSKPFFGGSEALLVHDYRTASVLCLRNLAEHNVFILNNRKILDAKYFNRRFACLYDNSTIAFVDCLGQEIFSFSLFADLAKILYFDEDVVCVSDGCKVTGYSLAGGSLFWSAGYARITVHEQHKGVLCIGMSDGVTKFVDISNGAILAAFEGTSQTVAVSCRNDLWMLGFDDGNIFALTLGL